MNVQKANLDVTKSVPTMLAVMSVAVGMVTTLTQITTLVMVSISLPLPAWVEGIVLSLCMCVCVCYHKIAVKLNYLKI